MTGDDLILRKGDVVTATYGERAVEARVILASENGKSLVIKWDDGMLGGHVGMMPILKHDQTGKYHSLIEGRVITLTRKP